MIHGALAVVTHNRVPGRARCEYRLDGYSGVTFPAVREQSEPHRQKARQSILTIQFIAVDT